MRRKTILFTESGTYGGGSFLSLHQMLGVMDRERYEPHVAFVNETPWLEKIRDMGVSCHLLTDPVYSLTVPRRVRKWLEKLEEFTFRHVPAMGDAVHRLCHGPLIRGLVRLVREHGVDLLYTNDQIDRDYFGLAVSRRAGIPVISHLRSVNGEPFTPGKARRANDHVEAFIARAGIVRDYWLGLGLDPEKVHLIENGIDFSPVEPVDVRKEFNLSPETKVLGCVGRIIPEKGHLFLIDGFACLLRRRPEVVLLIVGEGPHGPKVRAQVERMGLPNVVFAGQREDAISIMAGMDVMVQPAESDSFGRTVIEAMAVRTPLVCADTGGIREIIRHGENGLLVSYGDVEALADACEKLIDGGEAVDRMVEKGLDTVRNGRDLRSRVREVCAVVDAVLAFQGR